MSQNKTIIPESEYDLQHPINADTISSSDFYRPSGVGRSSTVIAGMNDSSIPSPIPSKGIEKMSFDSNHTQGRHIPLQERVIIGVLFSISKGLLGEIFPIYLGRNMIGSSSSCDICLKERTVNEEHAVLHIRCEGYPGDCYATLTDYGSSHGTTVNQKDCRYETLPVRDGDIVIIGKHYQLILKIFDILKSGLHEDSGFEDSDSSVTSPSLQNQTSYDFYSPSRSSGNDNRTVIG